MKCRFQCKQDGGRPSNLRQSLLKLFFKKSDKYTLIFLYSGVFTDKVFQPHLHIRTNMIHFLKGVMRFYLYRLFFYSRREYHKFAV